MFANNTTFHKKYLLTADRQIRDWLSVNCFVLLIEKEHVPFLSIHVT